MSIELSIQISMHSAANAGVDFAVRLYQDDLGTLVNIERLYGCVSQLPKKERNIARSVRRLQKKL